MDYSMYLHQIETTDGLVWEAEFPDVKGCVGSGNTPEEAAKTGMENLQFHLESLKECGMPIPEPKKRDVNYTYSGKLSLRISRSLHEEISKLSDEEGISINQYIVEAISEKTGSQKSISRIEKETLSVIKEACVSNYIQGFKDMYRSQDTMEYVPSKGVNYKYAAS